jgi:hypothetical protein
MDHLPIPLRAIHLHRIPHREPNSTVSKQRLRSTAIDAKIEVEVRAILVRPREPVLPTERVAARWITIVSQDS